MLEEMDLLHGLLNRKQEALSCLMDKYASVIYALISRILAGVGSDRDAEECVSDVFHTAWLRVHAYDPEKAPLRTWLLVLAKYIALDRRRVLVRRGEHKCLSFDEPAIMGLEKGFTRVEERERLQSALKTLSVPDRELVYRRYFLGESVDSLASVYGFSRQAMDNRLWRARKRLKAVLDEGEGEVVYEG